MMKPEDMVVGRKYQIDIRYNPSFDEYRTKLRKNKSIVKLMLREGDYFRFDLNEGETNRNGGHYWAIDLQYVIEIRKPIIIIKTR